MRPQTSAAGVAAERPAGSSTIAKAAITTAVPPRPTCGKEGKGPVSPAVVGQGARLAPHLHPLRHRQEPSTPLFSEPPRAINDVRRRACSDLHHKGGRGGAERREHGAESGKDVCHPDGQAAEAGREDVGREEVGEHETGRGGKLAGEREGEGKPGASRGGDERDEGGRDEQTAARSADGEGRCRPAPHPRRRRERVGEERAREVREAGERKVGELGVGGR
mmetsp:Transcript_43929/g.143978  ORF Transcript_43929/g.143978 Transcript_43929/m.143978 type:complete len:221 (+) Transcript_43929:480-1142(+)